ncbi:MAG: hypothetical protein J2P55_14840, partial [Rhizobiales bacterium]|nr:hypothetical protein [Hyphomicrobiales bacterium]
PDRALGSIGGELDREGMHAGAGHDLDRVRSGGTSRRIGCKERPAREQRRRREPPNAMARFAERM